MSSRVQPAPEGTLLKDQNFLSPLSGEKHKIASNDDLAGKVGKTALLIQNLNVSTIKTQKKILNNISMEANFGEITAIMGPSGSGKTSLLRYLAGLKSGNLKYEGEKYIVGDFKYVAQEDHLHGFMTVDKYINVYFGLNYGFVNRGDFTERERIKAAVLEDVQLTKTLHTKVGDIFLHGLSGGERRRLSMALELISKPKMIILDEPTSGLDSFAAEKVMDTLKILAKNEGMSVILTIHQPSSRIFKMLDKLILVKDGNLIYHAPASNIHNFFSSQGEEEWENYNPADQAIELLSKPDVKAVASKLYSSAAQVSEDQAREAKKENEAHHHLPKANILEKFLFLCYRNLKNIFFNPAVLGIRIAMYIMLCFMVGAMYWNLGEKLNHESIISRTSLLFYVDSFLVFMSIAALPSFMMERAIVEKEINNKLYNPILYQLSSWITSWIGVLIIALVSTILVVLMANLNGFGIFFVSLFLSLLIAEGVVALVAILVPHYIIGMALVAGMYGMFMLCQGFLVVKNDIPDWFIWGYYLAFHTYTFRAFMHNEFEPIASFSESNFSSGKAVLEFYSMGDVDLTHEFVILVGYILGVQILICIVMLLKYRKKD